MKHRFRIFTKYLDSGYINQVTDLVKLIVLLKENIVKYIHMHTLFNLDSKIETKRNFIQQRSIS